MKKSQETNNKVEKSNKILYEKEITPFYIQNELVVFNKKDFQKKDKEFLDCEDKILLGVYDLNSMSK